VLATKGKNLKQATQKTHPSSKASERTLNMIRVRPVEEARGLKFEEVPMETKHHIVRQ